MKYFINSLIIVAILLIIFNLTQLNYKNPLVGESKTALIGVVASSCAVIILLILKISNKIQEKL